LLKNEMRWEKKKYSSTACRSYRPEFRDNKGFITELKPA
jgi:hypothetical protein